MKQRTRKKPTKSILKASTPPFRLLDLPPELVLLIGKKLSQADLLSLLLSNRYLYSLLEPLLWRREVENPGEYTYFDALRIHPPSRAKNRVVRFLDHGADPSTFLKLSFLEFNWYDYFDVHFKEHKGVSSEILSILLERGGNPNTYYPNSQLGNYRTLLTKIIDINYKDALRAMFNGPRAHEVDVNISMDDIPWSRGYSPLIQSIQYGAVEAAEFLLEYGADIYHCDSSGFSAWGAAKAKVLPRSVEALIKRRHKELGGTMKKQAASK